MKRQLLSFLAFFFCLMGIVGQELESLNYEAIVHNAVGEVVESHPVLVKFSIIAENSSGSIIYSENHNTTTDQSGLISLEIGNGTRTFGDFASIDWSTGSFFLKVETDFGGGAYDIDLGTIQIVTIPYAVQGRKSKKPAPVVIEEELFMIRKYMGRFLEYRQTGTDNGGKNILWIKTSMDKTFGKISAYGKKCEFSAGDNLYLSRRFFSPGGLSGYWVYQIENDSAVYYKVSEFQHDKKVLVESWF